MENSQTEKQKELVEVIYTIHENLRKKHRKIAQKVAEDPEKTIVVGKNWEQEWQAHKEDTKTLEDYAVAMAELATEIWDPRISSAAEQATEAPGSSGSGQIKCRLEWVYSKSVEYFGRVKKVKLLDVGSCYNPFSRYNNYFDITPLDLHPAASYADQIYQCDFLDIAVGDRFSFKDDQGLKKLEMLPTANYDLAVFSFVLEYLPDQRQRRACCLKARDCVVDGGLVFILRPDSSAASEGHVRLIKRLKVGMALIGLKRVYCEKLEHVWCSAYVKLSSDEFEEFRVSKRFQNDLKKTSFEEEHELFAIQQDFKKIDLEKKVYVKEDFDVGLFDELPGDIG